MKAGGSVYREGGMYFWVHEYIMVLLSTHLTSLVRLLADEVDGLYVSLDSPVDICKEGAGKVYHRSPIPEEKFLPS